MNGQQGHTSASSVQAAVSVSASSSPIPAAAVVAASDALATDSSLPPLTSLLRSTPSPSGVIAAVQVAATVDRMKNGEVTDIGLRTSPPVRSAVSEEPMIEVEMTVHWQTNGEEKEEQQVETNQLTQQAATTVEHTHDAAPVVLSSSSSVSLPRSCTVVHCLPSIATVFCPACADENACGYLCDKHDGQMHVDEKHRTHQRMPIGEEEEYQRQKRREKNKQFAEAQRLALNSSVSALSDMMGRLEKMKQAEEGSEGKTAVFFFSVIRSKVNEWLELAAVKEEARRIDEGTELKELIASEAARIERLQGLPDSHILTSQVEFMRVNEELNRCELKLVAHEKA